MWTITGASHSLCNGVSRRNFLRVGGLLTGGLLLPRLSPVAAGETKPRRSVIFIYLAGGPSHFETFDPKPDAPLEIRGPYNSIPTALPGVSFCETMPKLAQIADKFSLVRSCCHDNPGHGGGERYVRTGYPSASPEFELPHDYPVFGSVVSKMSGAMSNGIPTYICCPPRGGEGPAYLGSAYGSFDVYSNGRPRGLQLEPMVKLDRLEDRRKLRAAFDQFQRSGDMKLEADALDELEQQAYEMISRPAAQRAFNVSEEPEPLRRRYGDHDPGKCMLLARRFVEAGAGIVEVRMGSWDHHGNAGGTITSGAKANCPPLDQALSALITDLEDRGLTDQVLVWCWGEFGRTPRINQFVGRDHWPQAMSVILSGGGLKNGVVVGETTRKGEHPVENRLRPADVLATVYQQIGIDPHYEFRKPDGRPAQILDHGNPIADLL